MSNRKTEFRTLVDRLDNLVYETNLLQDRWCQSVLESRARGWVQEVAVRREDDSLEASKKLSEAWGRP